MSGRHYPHPHRREIALAYLNCEKLSVINVTYGCTDGAPINILKNIGLIVGRGKRPPKVRQTRDWLLVCLP